MLILTAEQIFLSPWHAVGLKCNTHSQMLPGFGLREGSRQLHTQAEGGGGGLEQDANANWKGANSEIKA